jgi:branched-chain amino acid aminotransferase
MGRGGTNLVDDDDDDIELTVSERDVCVADLLDSVEVFVTGTAAEVVPVQSVCTSATPPEELLEYGDDAEGEEEESLYVKFPHGESSPGPVTTKLLDMLREVYAERRSCVATENWLCDVYSSPEDFRRGGLR